jgi:hypothetical protein
MTSHHNTTYHLKGIEILGGKLNLNEGNIEGVKKINIGDWSLEVGEDGDLCIKSEETIRVKITNDPVISSNLKYDRFFMVQPINVDQSIGLFVSSTNNFYNYDYTQSPMLDYKIPTLPTITLSQKKNDPSVIGVIVSYEKYNREITVGSVKSVYDQEDEVNRVLVNTSGLGTVWVCDINGSFSNGDLITTSDIPGYGMKQSDNIYKNYTKGKITHDCNFNPTTIVLKKPFDFDEKGPIYETLKNKEGLPITDNEFQLKYVYKNGVKTSRKEYEDEIEKLMKEFGKDRKTVLKSLKRNIYKACLVCFT